MSVDRNSSTRPRIKRSRRNYAEIPNELSSLSFDFEEESSPETTHRKDNCAPVINLVFDDSNLFYNIISYNASLDNLCDMYNICLVNSRFSNLMRCSNNIWTAALSLDWVFQTSEQKSDAISFLRSYTHGPLQDEELNKVFDMEAIQADSNRLDLALEIDPGGSLDIHCGLSSFEHIRLSPGLAVAIIGHEQRTTSHQRHGSMTMIMIEFLDGRVLVNELLDISTAEGLRKIKYFPNSMLRLKMQLDYNLPSTLKNSNILTLITVACFAHSVPDTLGLVTLSHVNSDSSSSSSDDDIPISTTTTPCISYLDEVQLLVSRFDPEAQTVFTTGVGGQSGVNAISTCGSLLKPVKIRGCVLVEFGKASEDITLYFSKALCPPRGKLIGPASPWNRGYFRSGILQEDVL